MSGFRGLVGGRPSATWPTVDCEEQWRVARKRKTVAIDEWRVARKRKTVTPLRALSTAARAQSYSHPDHRSRQSDRMIHSFVWDQSLLPLALSGRAKHPDRPRCS